MARFGAVIAGMALAGVGVVGVKPAMAGGSTDWKRVAAGGEHSCGITTARRLFCWGHDDLGQLGDGAISDPTSDPTPGQVVGNATEWKQVAAGDDHSCGITTARRLFCWGSDASGQLGDGTGGDPSDTPGQVVGNATNWKQVSAGRFHTCAVKTNGRLYCWGSDTVGQLGDGTGGGTSDIPGQVFGNATNWSQVSAGSFLHTCAVKTTGRLFCWGSDTSGQLGDGTGGDPSDTPGQVTGNATDWKQVAAGGDHSCGITTARRLFCWGSDASGQLGDGTGGGTSDTPGQVVGNATNWKQPSAGRIHTCAVKTNARLYCWGNDALGQLGDGTGGDTSDTPGQVLGNATNWSQPSAGSSHSCTVKTTGRVFCWGHDGFGQLGDGTPGSPVNDATPGEVASHP